MLRDAWIYLENGTYLSAKSFGADTTAVGEIVFNTSMSGYQEIITDPSYAGQFVTFTMPEIGNVGVNEEDMESAIFQAVSALQTIISSADNKYLNNTSIAAKIALESFNDLEIVNDEVNVKKIEEVREAMRALWTGSEDKK